MANIVQRGIDIGGGPARARVVVILAAVLGLQNADIATVAATAQNLKQEFDIGNFKIGLIVATVSLAAAAATLPFDLLVDRIRRTRLLTITVALWAVAMFVSGFAQSFLWLLLSRVALGMVTAAAGPAIASLTGDYFPALVRGRMWGYILAGELIGTGVGFVISGEIAALVGWRAAFWWLAAPSLLLAWLVHRLPEPDRGGQSKLQLGQVEIPDEREVDHGGADGDDSGDREEGYPEGVAGRVARSKEIRPNPDLVLHSDPTDRSLWWAVRYVLRIRTNVVLITASALGYFFFSGIQAFGLVFVTDHYNLPKSVASALVLVVGIGALAGVYTSGRFSDWWLDRGHINSRVLVPSFCLLAVIVTIAPALLVTSVAIALPLLTLGAALLGAVNPPLDAGRLDIMHPSLWGRAEGVRTVLRGLAQAAAPLVFGILSQAVFGGGDTGLKWALMCGLGAVLLAGLLALTALRTYPRDVATASASTQNEEHETDRSGDDSD